eukprot:2803170-Rhodomonas_salina.2
MGGTAIASVLPLSSYAPATRCPVSRREIKTPKPRFWDRLCRPKDCACLISQCNIDCTSRRNQASARTGSGGLPLSAYALITQSPVLTQCMALRCISLRICYAMPGTDAAYGGSRGIGCASSTLRPSTAMSGTITKRAFPFSLRNTYSLCFLDVYHSAKKTRRGTEIANDRVQKRTRCGTELGCVRPGKDLHRAENVGKLDPYVEMAVGDQVRRTKTDREGAQNPAWNQKLKCVVLSAQDRNPYALSRSCGWALHAHCEINSQKESSFVVHTAQAPTPAGPKRHKKRCWCLCFRYFDSVGDRCGTVCAVDFAMGLSAQVQAGQRASGIGRHAAVLIRAASKPKNKAAIKCKCNNHRSFPVHFVPQE